MFHSQGGVRPERKKRSLRLREDASPAPPDDAMLIIRSSSVGQVSACEKKRSIPVSDGHASRANIAREGAVGNGLVKHLKKSEGRFFRSGREGIAERPLGHTHPTEIYLC